MDKIAQFTWGFGQKFHLEVSPTENYEWSDPNYDGDNTIKPCGPYSEWLEAQNLDYGRDKGKHKISDYCPGAKFI